MLCQAVSETYEPVARFQKRFLLKNGYRLNQIEFCHFSSVRYLYVVILLSGKITQPDITIPSFSDFSVSLPDIVLKNCEMENFLPADLPFAALLAEFSGTGEAVFALPPDPLT